MHLWILFTVSFTHWVEDYDRARDRFSGRLLCISSRKLIFGQSATKPICCRDHVIWGGNLKTCNVCNIIAMQRKNVMERICTRVPHLKLIVAKG